MLQSKIQKVTRQKNHSHAEIKAKRKQDALELAQLIYDIYVEKQTSRLSSDKIVVKKV